MTAPRDLAARRAPSPQLIGRAAQLDQLRAALERASTGEPTAVLLGGEAGVGKTRLVAELVNEAMSRGVRVVMGQCVDLGGLPFAPIAGIVRELSVQMGRERLLDLAGPGRDALASLVPELGDPSVSAGTVFEGRGRLLEVVAVLLERVSAEQPLVLVIEDIHWADRSTLDVLRFVVRAVSSAPVLTVATYRSDEIGRSHPLRPVLAEFERVRNVLRVDVPRLSRDEVADLISDVTGRSAAPPVVNRVYQRTGGNPYFVEELVSADPDCGPGTLTDNLRDVLLLRTDQLSEPTQSLMRLMAAGGDRVEHDLVVAVSELRDTDLDDALREAVSANVVRVDGNAYVFRHALLREALHDDILPGAHVRYHRAYAEAIEANPSLMSAGSADSELAHHWYGAYDQERAFSATLRAAEVASRRYAYAEAQLFLERALELWERVHGPSEVFQGDHTDLLERASEAAFEAGEAERALALVEAALNDVEPDDSRRESFMSLRAKLVGQLDRPDGIDVCLDTLAQLSESSEYRAGVLSMLASRYMTAGRADEALLAAGEALEVARATGDAGAVFNVQNVMGPSHAVLGDEDACVAAFREAEEAAGDDHRLLVRYHVNYSDALNQLGRFADAVNVARAGVKLAAEFGLARTSGAMLSGNAAEPLIALGEWDEAERVITRALELDPPARHYWQLLRLRAWLQIWRGDLDGSAVTLDELQARLPRYRPGPQYTVPAARTMAEHALVRGDHDEAWAIIEPELERQRKMIQAFDMPLLVVGACVISYRRRAGGAFAAEQAQALQAMSDSVAGNDITRLLQQIVRAELAADNDASAWKGALALADTVPGPAIFGPYAAYRLAETLVESGDRAAAADALSDAVDRAERLGASLIVQWSGDLARRAGVSASWSRQSNGPDRAAGLTERESEVLRLVAAGRTNREIGDELFITAKTASVHVSNILAKLGVASRTEAASVAHQRGILTRP